MSTFLRGLPQKKFVERSWLDLTNKQKRRQLPKPFSVSFGSHEQKKEKEKRDQVSKLGSLSRLNFREKKMLSAF